MPSGNVVTVPGWSWATVQAMRPIAHANGKTYAMASRYRNRPAASTCRALKRKKSQSPRSPPANPPKELMSSQNFRREERVFHRLPREIGEDGIEVGDDEAGEEHVRQEVLDEFGVEALRAGPGNDHPPSHDHGHGDDRPERVDGERAEQVVRRLREVRDHGTYYMRILRLPLGDDGSPLFVRRTKPRKNRSTSYPWDKRIVGGKPVGVSEVENAYRRSVAGNWGSTAMSLSRGIRGKVPSSRSCATFKRNIPMTGSRWRRSIKPPARSPGRKRPDRYVGHVIRRSWPEQGRERRPTRPPCLSPSVLIYTWRRRPPSPTLPLSTRGRGRKPPRCSP